MINEIDNKNIDTEQILRNKNYKIKKIILNSATNSYQGINNFTSDINGNNNLNTLNGLNNQNKYLLPKENMIIINISKKRH